MENIVQIKKIVLRNMFQSKELSYITQNNRTKQNSNKKQIVIRNKHAKNLEQENTEVKRQKSKCVCNHVTQSIRNDKRQYYKILFENEQFFTKVASSLAENFPQKTPAIKNLEIYPV